MHSKESKKRNKREKKTEISFAISSKKKQYSIIVPFSRIQLRLKRRNWFFAKIRLFSAPWHSRRQTSGSQPFLGGQNNKPQNQICVPPDFKKVSLSNWYANTVANASKHCIYLFSTTCCSHRAFVKIKKNFFLPFSKAKPDSNFWINMQNE